ncbi:hypothetical protein [Acetobacter conturbans]|uniref:Uncharacterized protein n=1 Tax=Acetobacter conturbans TaxID=1737472 RepID=A0ABX0K1A2_9PROT|nr:hypothetical protein [Acetobacter conturbans]NHN89040.1 hypothetical protein [Acetobacter conturbans]
MPLIVGNTYSRNDIADEIELMDLERAGNWLTGVSFYRQVYYVFVNIGAAGRFGRNYQNIWQGNSLIWHPAQDWNLEQNRLINLISGNFAVNIFWRIRDREKFTYAGSAIALEVSAGPPIEVVWGFYPNVNEFVAPPIAENINLPPAAAFRRGPPPAYGINRVLREDGPTSVYLFKMIGPTHHVFPEVPQASSIVKIGISNCIPRRLVEMSCSFPRGCALGWQHINSELFENGDIAYRVEQKILDGFLNNGESLGGEFAFISVEREQVIIEHMAADRRDNPF